MILWLSKTFLKSRYKNNTIIDDMVNFIKDNGKQKMTLKEFKVFKKDDSLPIKFKHYAEYKIFVETFL